MQVFLIYYLALSLAAKWWSSYGTQAPTLQRMAIRILSLTASASGCERNWSCFERVSLPSSNSNMFVFFILELSRLD